MLSHSFATVGKPPRHCEGRTSHGIRLVTTHHSCCYHGHGIAKLLQNLLNHTSTANFENQTNELKAAISAGNSEVKEAISELKGTISGGNDALVSAIRALKQ